MFIPQANGRLGSHALQFLQSVFSFSFSSSISVLIMFVLISRYFYVIAEPWTQKLMSQMRLVMIFTFNMLWLHSIRFYLTISQQWSAILAINNWSAVTLRDSRYDGGDNFLQWLACSSINSSHLISDLNFTIFVIHSCSSHHSSVGCGLFLHQRNQSSQKRITTGSALCWWFDVLGCFKQWLNLLELKSMKRLLHWIKRHEVLG